MLGGREHGHVDADLGDDALRRCAVERRGSCRAAQRPARKGAICSSIASESRSICSSRKSMWARIAPIHSACRRSKRPSSASRSAGIFARSAALRELGEHLGVGRALDQRVEHRPAGDAEDVGRDAVELDPGVLERLVQPVGLALALLDLRLAIPGQVAQRADRLRRHEARPQQPGLGELAQPRRIRDVGLAAGDLLDVPGVDEQALELVLEDRPHRLPVHAGRLHRDLRDTVRGQPVTQRQQPRDRRRELRHMLLAPAPLRRHTHARGHLRLVNIQRRQGARRSSPPLLPSIGQQHESSPRGLEN